VSCALKNLRYAHEPVWVGLKLDEELDHQGRKENKTTSTTNLRNKLREVVELELKGGVLGITSQS
jgi:hypothetical protein